MNRSRTGRSLSSFALQLPAAGDRIGERYQVVEQLGRGGTSVVYRVRDQSTPRELALKQLSREAAENRETSALFEREFHTLAQLSHPSVIEVYDFGVDAAGPFYTMELLDGGDLTTREAVDVRTTCSLISQVCSSLALLHARRLVHRDVTARNVRCTADGRAKLIDFGAMAPFGPCRRSVGTPAFTAPEVLYQLSLDARTDLFSLGVTLYFALTGRLPYPARSFAELHDAWRHEPSRPSRFTPDVSPALDTLVLDLIHVDPTLRPRSASEVMHRLAAITGVPAEATHDFAALDVGSPMLVGRDAEQRRFRQRLHRALYGQGSALWIEGAPGLGRSRLLETCVLDAKTQGAIVLHVAGSAAATAPFQTAHRMIEQLLEILPQAALEFVRDADALRVLFDSSEVPQLLPLEALAGDRRELHATLRAWLQAVSARQPLMIALDDAHLTDEASLALLSALAQSAHERPLILALAAESPLSPRAAAVLNVLRGQALVLSLGALTREQTEQLLGSLFGSVPKLALLAERIQAATAGNPREIVALAQHLVDRKLIQHDAGTWVLPAELTLSILPADAESALRARVTALPAQALALLEAQSLARGDGFRRSDYALLSRAAGGPIDAALAALVAQDLLQCDGELYTLRQPALRACLSGMLSPERRAELHAQLAQLFAASNRPRLEEVHHWLFAGHTERGLDRLRPLLELEHSELVAQSRLDVTDVASTLASAFQLAVRAGRPAREICEIARHLTLLSRWGDDDWHVRYGRGWLRHLRHDLGLSDDPQLERAYTPEEALRHLTRYVTISTLIATRTHDPGLSATLPKLLEPFAGFSPRLYVAWQASLASDETTFSAQPERARARTLEVLLMLDQIADFEPEYRESLRTALHYAEGVRDVQLGTATLQSRLPNVARDPAQQVLAGYVARLVCIYAGDAEGAERERRHTEMLAVQAGVRPPYEVPLRLELPAYVHAQDLDGVKQVADRMAQLTARAPGWRPQHLLAIGCFERLRGDYTA
ncbi:MAG TPA: protein kinase, partial [Polyangiales bacterium]|nr:protein kinase [Polyangiales bacterium]